MTTSDLEKGDLASSVTSCADRRFFPNDGQRSTANQPNDNCIESWSAEFFSRIQSLSDSELAAFSKRTRVLEFRQLSRFYTTYLEWMLLQEMQIFKDQIKDPVRAQAKAERIGKMLHDYCKTTFVILSFDLNTVASQVGTRLGIYAST
jgi:hypothetical protein